MSVRTYGDKPIAFQLEDNGEYYCVGSEVRKELPGNLQELLVNYCFLLASRPHKVMHSFKFNC